MREPYPYDPKMGTPAGPSLVYTCAICGAEVRSIPAHHERWTCACRNISIDPDAGRLSLQHPSQFSISRIIDVRPAFSSNTVLLHTPIGPLLLGIVDPHAPGAAESVSFLLNRSIGDALASRGGHLPDWLVADIRQNYISATKIQTLWAAHGHRFAVARADDGEMIGTVHISQHHEHIFTVDRNILNVSAKNYPGFKPDRSHHIVNISVKHECRRAGIGRAMIDGILQHFRDRLDGDALWVRADPPWHAGLMGLGFSHDPSMDIFLPPEVERTSNLPHAVFNARYACACISKTPQKPDFLPQRALLMQTHKLQYVSMTRPFEEAPQVAKRLLSPLPKQTQPDRRYFRDWGGTVERIPKAVFCPASPQEVADILGSASAQSMKVTVRGLGRSAGAQALSEGGWVVSTEGLAQIDQASLTLDCIRVQGGVTWEQLLEMLLPHGLVPPVVPGFLSATVGGTLSSGGFSKGSIKRGFVMDHVLGLTVVTGDGRLVECSPTQAGWLFEAVLGGLGRFGVIVSATLALERAPRGILKSELCMGEDLEALNREMLAFAAEPDAYHATGFLRADEQGELQPVMVCARKTESAGDVLFSEYLMPPREREPRGPSLWAHVFCPAGALGELLREARGMLRPGDALQWLPIQKNRAGRSLVRAADVPLGALFYALMLTRWVEAGGEVEELEGEHRAFVEHARRLGGKNAMGGVLPRDEKEWRGHLGEDLGEVQRWAKMADPAGMPGFGGELR